MYTTCILGAHEGQKRTLGVLELELQMAVSHHGGSGNQTPVLCTSSQHSQLLSCLFRPCCFALSKTRFHSVSQAGLELMEAPLPPLPNARIMLYAPHPADGSLALPMLKMPRWPAYSGRFHGCHSPRLSRKWIPGTASCSSSQKPASGEGLAKLRNNVLLCSLPL